MFGRKHTSYLFCKADLAEQKSTNPETESNFEQKERKEKLAKCAPEYPGRGPGRNSL